MGYLDLLMTGQTGAPPIVPAPPQGPLPAFLTLGQPQPVQPDPAMMQPASVAAPAPQMAPQPMIQGQPEANPFEQLDQPATAPVSAPMAGAPAPQTPATPVVDTAQSNGHVSNGIGSTVGTTPEVSEAVKAFTSDMSALINSGASRDALKARVAEAQKVLPGITVDFDAALAYREKHPGASIPTAIRANPQVAPRPQDTHGEDKGQLDAFGNALADGITMKGLDEIGGAIGATTNAVKGVFGGGTGEAWTDAYGRIRDENRQTLENSQYYHPGTYLAGEIAGNLLTAPVTSLRGGATIAKVVAESAGQGFVNGFNSGTDGITERLELGGKGALLGAAGGALVGGATNGIARRIARNRAGNGVGQEVLDAADRLNRRGTSGAVTGEGRIDPMVGHVTGTAANGGVGAKAQALLEPTFFGGGFGGLWKKTDRFNTATAGAAERIARDAAGGTSRSLTDTADILANPNVPGSLGAYSAETQAAAQRVYGAAEQAANGIMVPAPQAIGRLDEIIQRYGVETPGDVPGLEALQNLRASLARGENPNATSAGWSIEGLRRLRTSFGDNLDSNSRTAKEAANEIWGPLSDDIFRGLRVSGRGNAAQLYRHADRMWARRAAGVEVIERIIGKEGTNSADQVADRIASMARKDYVHLARALREIDPAQAGMVRGSLIQSLGRPVASRATETPGFSLESFATRWGSMSNPAKRATFDPQTVRDLDDLTTLAFANRRVGQNGNPSRSGIFLENARQATRTTEVLASIVGGGPVNPAVLSAIGGAAGLGSLLGSPGVARALVRGMRSGKVETTARVLTALAARTPTAQQDILNFRDVITGGVPDQAAVATFPQQEQQVEAAAPIPVEEQGVAPIDPAMVEEVNPFDQFGEE